MLDGERVPLVEPFVVPDTYATGLHDIEHLGDGLYRLTLYAKQRSAMDGHSEERIVVARLVLSTMSIFHSAQWALKAIGVQCCGALGRAGLIH